MEYVISKELAQSILDYLAERPFREVAVLVSEMQKMQLIPAPEANEIELPKDGIETKRRK